MNKFDLPQAQRKLKNEKKNLYINCFPNNRRTTQDSGPQEALAD